GGRRRGIRSHRLDQAIAELANEARLCVKGHTHRLELGGAHPVCKEAIEDQVLHVEIGHDPNRVLDGRTEVAQALEDALARADIAAMTDVNASHWLSADRANAHVDRQLVEGGIGLVVAYEPQHRSEALVRVRERAGEDVSERMEIVLEGD